MMQVFHPDLYIENYQQLNIEKLKERGIRFLLCDVDNTLVAFDDPDSNHEVHRFIESLKEHGITVVLMSNNFAFRTERFGRDLGVEKIYSFSCKPFPFTYWKAMRDYHMTRKETAILGDQLFTDILGGYLAGIYTVLTHPIVDRERIDTRILRFFEKIMYNYYKKKNIMERGNFDD